MGSFLSGLAGAAGPLGGKLKSALKPKPKPKQGTFDNLSSGQPQNAHHGAKIRKSGLVNLKKGERVLTKGQQKGQAKEVRKRLRGK